MRIVFMGTPAFAVPCLERVLADGHEVALVVSQADRPKGRGYALLPTPVKASALTHNLSVYQPEKIRGNAEAAEKLAACRADAFVVVAYGKILPRDMLDLPRMGCVNVHASLLPLYRGAAPIQWAVLNGETETGVTTMLLDAGMDTGDMLLERRVALPPDMTAGELHDLLMQEGAQALSDTLREMEAGSIKRRPQRHDRATHAPMLDKSLSPIDWNKDAAVLHNRIRGLNPWPSAVTVCGGKTLKLHRSEPLDTRTDARPGTLLSIDPMTVACGGGSVLELREVQAEGGRRMEAAEFARGRRLQPGNCLGNTD